MTEISIENMSVAEKLTFMETLWSDLCAHAQIEPPAWHQEVINNRHQLRQSGEQSPMDWNEARQAIRSRVR